MVDAGRFSPDEAVKAAGLKLGHVDPVHFELLVKSTSITSEKTIAALRDYLVNGLPLKEAYLTNDVAPTLIYRRLKVLLDASKTASELSIFYKKKKANV